MEQRYSKELSETNPVGPSDLTIKRILAFSKAMSKTSSKNKKESKKEFE